VQRLWDNTRFHSTISSMIQQFEFVLQSARMITPRVRELAFTRADGQPVDYEAGQFITLHIPHTEKVLRRSYSIATMPAEGEAIRIAAAEVDGGRATGVLFGMQPGDKVSATGPFGRFVLRDDAPCRYVLIATGTGVTPFRAMLPELERRIDLEDFEVDLLLGVRGPDELLYGEEFLRVADKHPRFRFHASYSRRMPDAPNGREYQGYAQQHLDSLQLNPQRDIVYLCGNPGMIDAAAADLQQRGFPIQNVRREKYVSSN